MWRDVEEIFGDKDHGPPLRRGRLGAKPEEREDRSSENRRRNAQCRCDYDFGGDVRQDMPHDNTGIRGPDCATRLHILPRAHPKYRAARDADERWRGGDSDSITTAELEAWFNSGQPWHRTCIWFPCRRMPTWHCKNQSPDGASEGQSKCGCQRVRHPHEATWRTKHCPAGETFVQTSRAAGTNNVFGA